MKKNLKKSMVGIELLRLLAYEGERIFSTDRARELAPRVGLKDSYLCEALYHLRQNNWIVPIRRGLYYLSFGAYGGIPAHEFEIAMNLANPAAISHWSAMNHHGLNEQIPRTIFVLTTTESSVPRKRGIKREDGFYRGYRSGNASYKFIQVRPEYFFGTEKILIGNTLVSITDPERTLLDGLCRPQYCAGNLAETLHAFNVIGDSLNVRRIVEYALRMNVAVAKRLGWVLEYWDYDFSEFRELAELPVKGYRKLDPLGPRKGPCNSRWMIQENLPGNIISW